MSGNVDYRGSVKHYDEANKPSGILTVILPQHTFRDESHIPYTLQWEHKNIYV